MVFKKNLVVCLKVGGKVLRESSDRVELPFGSEYSILVKNLNSVRAEFRISIDGKDTSDGQWFVVEPNRSVNIERFLKNGNLAQGNRFKFIERTSQVEKARGIEAEDGLVRVEYRFEKKLPQITTTETHHYHYDHWGYSWPYWNYRYNYQYNTPIWTLTNTSGAIQSQANNSTAYNCSTSGANHSSSPVRTMNMMKSSGSEGSTTMDWAPQNVQNEEGITVPGSISNQQFQNVSGFETESQTEVIVLKLIGRHGKVEVTQPKTVDVKNKCSICAKTNKANSKFCSECGTSLVFV